MKKTIIVFGSIKNRPEKILFDEFFKRLIPSPVIYEIAPKSKTSLDQEAELVFAYLKEDDYVIALTEEGKQFTTRELKNHLDYLENQTKRGVFVIGSAQGLGFKVKKRADFSLSLGLLTLPHLFARFILIEQLYRCQQINLGHPYHRD